MNWEEPKRAWQIAPGDGRRDYADVFLRYGVAAVGPGDPGPFFDHRDEYLDPARRIYRRWMRSFCEDPQVGDLFVLRGMRGRTPVARAVGIVDRQYKFEPGLGDVEGWDLQHTLGVAWRIPREPVEMPGLNTRGTFSQSHQVLGRALAVWRSLASGPSPEPIPPPPEPLTDDELINRLIDHGVATGRAEVIASAIWRLRRLARWYSHNSDGLLEHEIRTFLIAPLLLALGWPEQQIRIEYQHADIALFNRSSSDAGATVSLIVESKRFWDPLGGRPIEQAKRYARRHPRCAALVVSDGARYKLLRLDESGDWRTVAYTNFLRPFGTRHPTDLHVGGADALFLGLLPQ